MFTNFNADISGSIYADAEFLKSGGPRKVKVTTYSLAYNLNNVVKTPTYFKGNCSVLDGILTSSCFKRQILLDAL